MCLFLSRPSATCVLLSLSLPSTMCLTLSLTHTSTISLSLSYFLSLSLSLSLILPLSHNVPFSFLPFSDMCPSLSLSLSLSPSFCCESLFLSLPSLMCLSLFFPFTKYQSFSLPPFPYEPLFLSPFSSVPSLSPSFNLSLLSLGLFHFSHFVDVFSLPLPVSFTYIDYHFSPCEYFHTSKNSAALQNSCWSQSQFFLGFRAPSFSFQVFLLWPI